MRSHRQEIDAHFSQHPLLQLRNSPHLRHAVFRLTRLGHLTRLLPGLYAPSDRAADPHLRMAALQLRDPDVVFTGLSAAGLLWDPTLLPATVEAAGRLDCVHTGFDVQRRRIDEDWISEVGEGIRVTRPPLTAVDLIPDHGGRFVDHLLREAGDEGAAVLELMWAALRAHPRRPGNERRAELLSQSRSLPWSEAERLAHEHLREAGLTGWLTNHRIVTPSGTYFADIAFPAIPLVIEIDGYEHHGTRTAFEDDRTRQNGLVTGRWEILRFTWATIEAATWLAELMLFLEHHPHGHLVLP